MKFRNLFRSFLLITVLITTFVSCNNEDYKTGDKDVSETVQNGTWRVAYFYESGEIKTQNYEGYNFTFGNNTVITASKEPDTYTGTWSVSKSTSDTDIYSTMFMIAFSTPVLVDLTGNWKVIENTGTSLKLKDDSQGDTNVSLLYFEKN